MADPNLNTFVEVYVRRCVSAHTAVNAVEGEKKEIWKVQWNVTGTTLASSGDDGIIRLWKRNLAGDWESTEVQQAYGALPDMF